MSPGELPVEVRKKGALIQKADAGRLFPPGKYGDSDGQCPDLFRDPFKFALFIPVILKRIGRSFGLFLQWYSFLRNPARNPMVNHNHALVNFFQVSFTETFGFFNMHALGRLYERLRAYLAESGAELSRKSFSSLSGVVHDHQKARKTAKLFRNSHLACVMNRWRTRLNLDFVVSSFLSH